VVDLGHERPRLPAQARNLSPIVPRASISARALVAVDRHHDVLASITTVRCCCDRVGGGCSRK